MSRKCKLKIGDNKIKQIHEFKYHRIFLTEERMCKIKMQRRFAIAKDAFHKLSRILRNIKITLETKKIGLNCNMFIGPFIWQGVKETLREDECVI